MARAARDGGFRVVVVCRVRNCRQQILDEQFELYPIELRRSSLNPVRELVVLVRLFRLYRKIAPDVVHHVAMKPVIYGSLAALGVPTSKVVNALAGFGFVFASDKPRARLLRPLLTTALRWCLTRRRSHVLVQNGDDKEFMRGLGVPESRVSIIAGSGVDCDHFFPVNEPPGPVVVTLVARMLWDKGISEFVAAARLLKGEHPQVVFQLVGDTDALNPGAIGIDRLNAWQAEGAVLWRKFQSDIRSVWHASHIAVLPSYREGLPLSLLEAAACAKPLVATDVPGCRALVSDGENGLLVAVKDPRALASAIGRLIRDAELRAKFGANARATVLEKHSVTLVSRQIGDLYRQLSGNTDA